MNENHYKIDLLQELDNISKVHWMERETIDKIMHDFGARITKTLNIERMSVWLFNPANDLVSMGEYDARRIDSFGKASVLYAEDYPIYFSSIRDNKIIHAINIHEDPRTKEFLTNYAIENEIITLLDIPLRMEGKLVGVMCFEKTGPIEKEFSESELSFAFSVSFVFSSNLEARRRRATQNKLEEVIKEKELLIREMNHRVKNNFSILISLMRISKNIGHTTDPRILIEEYEQRIFSMMKIHDFLFKTGNYTTINISSYLQALIKEYRRSYPEYSSVITSDLSATQLEVTSKLVLHIGLIVTEIFLNSIKYASENQFGFHVAFKKSNNSSYLLTITDKGKGFNFHETLKTGTMGVNLIKDLSEELNITAEFPVLGIPKYQFKIKA